jgi:hypothetical protein
MTDATNQADATKRPSRAGDELDDRVEQAIGDRAAQETDSTLDAMKSAASDAADRGAAAMADAASQARAVTEDALDDAEDMLEDAAEWVEEKYRENPALVIGLAVAAGVALIAGAVALIRAVFRR